MSFEELRGRKPPSPTNRSIDTRRGAPAARLSFLVAGLSALALGTGCASPSMSDRPIAHLLPSAFAASAGVSTTPATAPEPAAARPPVSSPPPEGRARVSAPRTGDLVEASRTTSADWATSTREGRDALREHDFTRAEARFVSALEAATRFRAHDVRIAASFGNVVRVASVYERIGREEDAERVMTRIASIAERRRDGARWVERARDRYAEMVRRPLHARLTPEDMPRPPVSESYDRLIRATAAVYEVDPALVKAVVAAESNFERRAVSRVGAQGLMQLMPATARELGVRRPFAPSENIRGGVRYLRALLDRFEDLDHALAAYNAGPEAVVRYGGIPPYPETEAYVSRVRRHYVRYQASFAH